MYKLRFSDRYIIARYGSFFNNTGGNDIVELIERESVNYQNDGFVAQMQACCYAQLKLLGALNTAGLLILPGSPPGSAVDPVQRSEPEDPDRLTEYQEVIDIVKTLNRLSNDHTEICARLSLPTNTPAEILAIGEERQRTVEQIQALVDRLRSLPIVADDRVATENPTSDNTPVP